VTHFRTFRNGDPPALAALWNRAVPARATARPLSGHEFDTHVVSKPHFDAAGLVVAERAGHTVGFVHAGFGPELPPGPPHQLSHALGTIGMLVLDPEAGAGTPDAEADAPLAQALIAAAEHYLRERGAKVWYAGGQYPLNPFYWGIYGGSEWAGVLTADAPFLRAVVAAGYQPVSTTVLLEADLSAPEPRDPRSALIRRQARLEVVEDALPNNWWDALAIGEFRPARYRLLARADDTELAHATTWDMSWFGRGDGRARIGLIDLEVDPRHRRKGFGRHLVAEILRRARTDLVAMVAVQTAATNTPALALYESLQFDPVETSILYRKGGAGDPGDAPGA
jgi:ribosomal protein S18 acetylase RimI-like enzyme